MFKLAVTFLLVACASQILAVPMESRGITDIIKCVEAKGQDVNDAIHAAEAAVDKCVKNAADQVDTSKPEVAALVKQILDKVEEINSITLNCVKDNLLKPISAKNCISSKTSDARKKLGELIVKLKEHGQHQIEDIITGAINCVKPVIENTIEKVETAAKEALQCFI